jgi:hypothetical protein
VPPVLFFMVMSLHVEVFPNVGAVVTRTGLELLRSVDVVNKSTGVTPLGGYVWIALLI